MTHRIGVVLSGSGVQDGSEIHEAVLTLLAIDRAGAEALCMAPDRDQADVVNHLRNAPMKEKRNVLVESARIARGKIRDLKTVRAADVDAVVLPGGFGAAKNLSTFASDGSDCRIDPEVERFLREVHAAGKPIGALCIAPALLARLFGGSLHPMLTIGTDAATAAVLDKTGATHVPARVTDVVVDRKNRFVTTPCYMLAGRITEVAEGAEKAIRALLELAG